MYVKCCNIYLRYPNLIQKQHCSFKLLLQPVLYENLVNELSIIKGNINVPVLLVKRLIACVNSEKKDICMITNNALHA